MSTRKNSPAIIDGLLNLEYIVLYHIDGNNQAGGNNGVINTELYKLLKVAFDSNVLPILLRRSRPIPLASLVSKASISARGLREQLRKLEKIDVVERFWYERRKGVKVSDNWRMALKPLLKERESKVSAPRNLYVKLVRSSFDCLSLEFLTSGRVNLGEFVNLEKLMRPWVGIKGKR